MGLGTKGLKIKRSKKTAGVSQQHDTRKVKNETLTESDEEEHCQ